jgi:hypothetical protein
MAARAARATATEEKGNQRTIGYRQTEDVKDDFRLQTAAARMGDLTPGDTPTVRVPRH